MIVWQNGELLAEEEVRISPFDTGLTLGVGVFETLIVERGCPFAWTRHFERLCQGAQVMGIRAPDEGFLKEGAIAVLEANEFDSARMRITLTGGAGGPGVSKKGAPVCLITTTPFVEYPECVEVGLSEETVDSANQLSGVKSLSYAHHILAMTKGRNLGWDEVLLFNEKGNLCEGATSNIFIEDGGVVKTPPLSDGCLAGVTRQLLIGILKSNNIPIEEVSLTPGDVDTSDGIWLSSSTRHVQWATRAGDRTFGVPSPLFQKMRASFETLRLEDGDP